VQRPAKSWCREEQKCDYLSRFQAMAANSHKKPAEMEELMKAQTTVSREEARKWGLAKTRYCSRGDYLRVPESFLSRAFTDPDDAIQWLRQK
jgi:hypothetical protein